MASRLIDQATYDALMGAYREDPGNAERAARLAKCGRKLARRAWSVGWLDKFHWAKPIQLALKEEHTRIRAEQRRQEEDARRKGQEERDKARQDALASMAQEGRILALARADVQGALGSASLMLPALRAMAEKAAATILADPGQFSPKAATVLLREFATAVRSLATAGEQIIRAERLHKGEPTDILGLSSSPAEMSLEEAFREIKAASSLYELAKRQGLVVEPGPDGGEPGPDTPIN